jgi:uncharacterized protein YndB with AHSA1/START domain
MNTEPLVFERTYHAPIQQVWEAFTDKDKMRKWYFDVDDFKPEVGFEFHFYGEKDGQKFYHNCVVIEVIPGKKLVHTWAYENYTGEALLTIELFDEGDKTRLKLTHAGLETFAVFSTEDFTIGWTYFTGKALPEFLES